MKETKHTRKKTNIYNKETGEETAFDSINAAKRESRKLQLEHAGGKLGTGILKLEN